MLPLVEQQSENKESVLYYVFIVPAGVSAAILLMFPCPPAYVCLSFSIEEE